VCNDGQEIPLIWACDEFADCTDESDEIEGCMIEFFTCMDGGMIPLALKCNMTPECEDGSDELDCP
jgi:hypothetical protein